MGRKNSIRDARVRLVVAAARKAAAEGRTVFVGVLNLSVRWGRNSGEVLDWGPMVEAVEAEGWTLEQWTVGPGARGPAGYPLFRRSAPASRGEQ